MPTSDASLLRRSGLRRAPTMDEWLIVIDARRLHAPAAGQQQSSRDAQQQDADAESEDHDEEVLSRTPDADQHVSSALVSAASASVDRRSVAGRQQRKVQARKVSVAGKMDC